MVARLYQGFYQLDKQVWKSPSYCSNNREYIKNLDTAGEPRVIRSSLLHHQTLSNTYSDKSEDTSETPRVKLWDNLPESLTNFSAWCSTCSLVLFLFLSTCNWALGVLSFSTRHLRKRSSLAAFVKFIRVASLVPKFLRLLHLRLDVLPLFCVHLQKIFFGKLTHSKAKCLKSA